MRLSTQEEPKAPSFSTRPLLIVAPVFALRASLQLRRARRHPTCERCHRGKRRGEAFVLTQRRSLARRCSAGNPAWFCRPLQSHAGKVVLRSWYEKNKHIFPASRWEPYDPEKKWDKYTVRSSVTASCTPGVRCASCCRLLPAVSCPAHARLLRVFQIR